MARLDLPPLGPPPADLHRRELFVTAWTKALYRVHRVDKVPLFFGATGVNRFDDPRGEFAVLYTSADLDGAFSETFAGVSSLSVTALSARAWCLIQPGRTLRVCDLRQHGLARIGADGRLCTGDRSEAQQWSRALWSHPAEIDGIVTTLERISRRRSSPSSTEPKTRSLHLPLIHFSSSNIESRPRDCWTDTESHCCRTDPISKTDTRVAASVRHVVRTSAPSLPAAGIDLRMQLSQRRG